MDPSAEPPRKLHPTVLDTSVIQIARVYAKALFDAAAKAGRIDAVLEEYESFAHDVLDNQPSLERALISAIVSRADKEATIRRVFEGRASPVFFNYLLVLNDHLRLELIRPALDQFRTIREQQRGQVRVEVRSAVALSSDQEQALLQRLQKLLEGEPVVYSQVEPALLGGLVIRIADTVYDGSVRARIRRLREQLLQRGTHEIQSRRDQFSTAT